MGTVAYYATNPAVMPKTGDTSADITIIALIGAISAVGLFVGLKKRREA